MQRKNLDLSIALLIAAINVGWALLPDHPAYLNIIGIILALPLIFVLPGYTLTEALFKRSSNSADTLIRQPALQLERPFKTSDRLIVGLGLSLALVIISGFILNMFPTGLQALSWVVCLSVQTMLFALIAAYRRRKTDVTDQAVTNPSPRFRITISDCLLLGLAVLVALGSFSYATLIAEQQQHPGFTQLWMLPQQANNSCAVLIGVHSNESSETNYRVEMTVNGAPAANWQSVALTPQQDWNQVVPLKPASSNKMDVEVELYRTDKPNTVYRNTHMTLNSSGGNIQCSLK